MNGWLILINNNIFLYFTQYLEKPSRKMLKYLFLYIFLIFSIRYYIHISSKYRKDPYEINNNNKYKILRNHKLAKIYKSNLNFVSMLYVFIYAL